MPRVILPSTHPNLARMSITGDLTLDDMACDEELGLNAGTPMVMLLDVTGMRVWLPDGFLDGARNSFFINPNLKHLAIVVQSPLLKSVALVVAKLTQGRDRLTLHDTVASAEAHLAALLRKLRTDN